MRIYHISDLHIRSDWKHNFEVERKLADLAKKLTPTDLIIATGDITDDGTEIQYANALKLLTPFTNRIIVVPGNHDLGKCGLLYDKKCVGRFNTLKSLVENPSRLFTKLRILDIDSCLKTKSPLDFARGDVGFWARRKIRSFGVDCRKKKQFSVVALHHTPFEEHWALKMKSPETFIRACEGIVDYVLVGHEHKERKVHFAKEGGRVCTTYYSAPSLANENAHPIPIDIDFLDK